MKLPNRQNTILLTIGICYFAVIAKLFYIQIIKYPELSRQLSSQNYKTTIVKPSAGSILDDQGSPLLYYQTLFRINLYKPELKTKLESLVKTITESNPKIEPIDVERVNKFAANDKQKWLNLTTLFSQEQIANFKDPGIVAEETSRSFFPEGTLGNIFLNNNGLPSYYRRQLSGKAGFSWETKDAVGNTILTHPGWIIDPVAGQNITTHVNRQSQYLIEKVLKEGITEFSADSGEILIMDSKSGGIIAMTAQSASSSAEATPSAYTSNPIISNLFEPGSIVKPLIMTLALDSNSIKDDFICTQCNRPIQIGQYSISNWDSAFHANSSLRDIIKNSDNIGMSHIINQVGYDRFIKYFKLLGFDKKTGIDLPGEARPLQKSYWPEIDLATASFGQGFAVTQIQMLTAFNVIANDGNKVSPHFTNEQKTKPVSVYKPETVEKMKDILKYSVENGVVAKFKPNSLEVCGKSGTSQVAVKGGYSDSSTIASYIGFSPCHNPKFTMIVTIHNPKTSPWGSSTAAPIWYKIAEKLPSLL